MMRKVRHKLRSHIDKIIDLLLPSLHGRTAGLRYHGREKWFGVSMKKKGNLVAQQPRNKMTLEYFSEDYLAKRIGRKDTSEKSGLKKVPHYYRANIQFNNLVIIYSHK